jgi:hypothetical protein
MIAPGIFVDAARARGNADDLHVARNLFAQAASAVQAIEN